MLSAYGRITCILLLLFFCFVLLMLLCLNINTRVGCARAQLALGLGGSGGSKFRVFAALLILALSCFFLFLTKFRLTKFHIDHTSFCIIRLFFFAPGTEQLIYIDCYFFVAYLCVCVIV